LEQIITSETLNEAIVIYLGYGILPYPSCSKDRIIEKFNFEIVNELINYMENILNYLDNIEIDWDFFARQTEKEWQEYKTREKSDSNWNFLHLMAAANYAILKLREKYPEINDEAANVLSWGFSWWNK
jgi:hypothetical protein